MNPSHFLMAFGILFGLKISLKIALDLLNHFHLRRHGGQVPNELADLVQPEHLQAIDAYNAAKIRYQMIHFLFSSCLLYFFLFTPLFSLYTLWVNGLSWPYIIKGTTFFLILTLLSWLVDLPWNYYYHFSIEARHGFNKYSPGSWFIDAVKGLILNVVLTVLVLTVVFSLWGDDFTFRWSFVLIGWTLAAGLIITLVYLVPVLFIPFFYKLNPLAEGPLKQALTMLVTESGFRVRGIYVADESRKSTHANAQFAGFGKSKSVILFDTLIEKFSEAEILGVLAHEIGHGRRRHIPKLIAVIMTEAFAFILFASALLAISGTYEAFGISKIFYSGAFLTYILFFDILLFFVQPLISRLSRRFEYQADLDAKVMLNTGEPLISTFKKFITHELSNINPHPIYEAFYYSHPSLLKRIRALREGK